MAGPSRRSGGLGRAQVVELAPVLALGPLAEGAAVAEREGALVVQRAARLRPRRARLLDRLARRRERVLDRAVPALARRVVRRSAPLLDRRDEARVERLERLLLRAADRHRRAARAGPRLLGGERRERVGLLLRSAWNRSPSNQRTRWTTLSSETSASNANL